MNKAAIVGLLILAMNPACKVFAQGDSLEVIKPILIDKSSLSGLGLKKVERKDQPGRDFFQKSVFRGKDLSVFIVSSQSWTAPVNNFPIDEYVYMLNGNARVKDSSGNTYFFNSFDHFFAPKGLKGEWEIMAGDSYHYELSVISTQRSPTGTISSKLSPHLLDRNLLSGSEIDFNRKGVYEELLVSGDELRISIKAERLMETRIDNPSKEQVICLLSGQVTIKDSGGDFHTFFSGDFFILPQGFIGVWRSEGHGMTKYLRIEKVG